MGQALHPVQGARGQTPGPARRFGYLVAVVVNGVLLWVVNRLLDWGWPPVLTDAFDDLLPFVDASLVATIVVNVLWMWRDPDWFKDLGQLCLDIISLVVVVRTWQIFPFDFSGYWSGWETLARIALGIGFFGLIIDTLFRLGRLVRTIANPRSPMPAG